MTKKPTTKPAAKPAKKPAKGNAAKFTWQAGDLVISATGKLPPGSKPIKAPKKPQPAPKPTT